MEKGEVLEVLKRVYDPDYRDRSIVEMGLVTEADISLDQDEIYINYGLTAPLCPFSAAIGLMLKYAVERELGRPVRVRLKAEHRQAAVVAELLQDEARCRELMDKLVELGIIEQCVRL